MNNITSIGIIGYGQFGKLIQTLCQHHFPETDIRIFSRRAQVDQVTFFSFEETCKTDIIFPCSPIPYLEQTIDNMQPHLGEKSIVRDVCSIKKHPINILKKHPNTKYIATHPMFGPNSYKTNKTLKGATIAVCDHNLDPEAYQSMISIINTLQLNCITLSADDHDKKLAETLFISHFISQTIVEA